MPACSYACMYNWFGLRLDGEDARGKPSIHRRTEENVSRRAEHAWVKDSKLHLTEEFKSGSRLQIVPCYSRLQFLGYFTVEVHKTLLILIVHALIAFWFCKWSHIPCMVYSSQIAPILSNACIPWDILMYLSISHVGSNILLQTLPLPLNLLVVLDIIKLMMVMMMMMTIISTNILYSVSRIYKTLYQLKYQHIIFGQPNISNIISVY